VRLPEKASPLDEHRWATRTARTRQRYEARCPVCGWHSPGHEEESGGTGALTDHLAIRHDSRELAGWIVESEDGMVEEYEEVDTGE